MHARDSSIVQHLKSFPAACLGSGWFECPQATRAANLGGGWTPLYIITKIRIDGAYDDGRVHLTHTYVHTCRVRGLVWPSL